MSIGKRCVTAILLALTAGVALSAAVPPMINYQGKLMQPSGVPVSDGTYTMLFAIYGQATGGTALWSETNPSVQVKGGLFAVLLGSVNNNVPANIFDSPDRWFGVTVGTDPEMNPRQQIASVAYAQVAGTVPDGSITASKLATGVAIPPGTVVMWSGSIASIPQGWALCDGQGGTPDLRDKFIAGAGLGYAVGATGGTATNNAAHAHVVASHRHSISQDGNHGHGPAAGNCTAVVAQCEVNGFIDGNGRNTVWSGNHTHGGNTGYASPATDSQLGIIDNRPPYYALCFIMKLAY